MFKKYDIRVRSRYPEIDGRKYYSVSFYVHSKSTRGGFLHEACVIGSLPSNTMYGMSDRRAKKSYVNRTWESWDGQDVLRLLWNKVLSLPGMDKSAFPKKCPFDSEKEPKHTDITTPEDLF